MDTTATGIECSAIYLYPSLSYLTDEDHEDQHALHASFSRVYRVCHVTEAIERAKEVRRHDRFLFLIDLDALGEEEDTITLSSLCSTTTTLMDTRIALIQKIARDLPTHLPLVVCSKDHHRIMDCIHAGAKDYLTKPFRQESIQTLFLKTYQLCQKPSPHCLRQRIKEMTFYNLPHIMTGLYAPSLYTPRGSFALPKQRRSEIQSGLTQWSFSPFQFNESELMACVYSIFDQLLELPSLGHLSSIRSDLYDFIVDLAYVYHDDNAYHNFAHAVDVLQCSFYMLCELGILPFTQKTKTKEGPPSLIQPVHAFALLIAAIGHDAAHPGVNNAFLTKTANPLALLYNDRSVLENLHSVTLFQLLSKYGIDTKLENPHEFRKIVISSILATDMAFHTDYVDQLKKQAERSLDWNLLEDAMAEKERLLFCSAIIKCADISNVTRPFSCSEQWAKLLVQEFSRQGDLEKELGLPVLPMNDRSKIVLEDSQIGFIQYVALDLFQSVCQVLPSLMFTVDQLKTNLERWQEIKEEIQLTEKIKLSLPNVPR
ncbi:hypothetical protein BY458DRAFT_558087 [Sporodiniella umbellata]|nr:hypothetical protein BY458DRAFT_558087 [Sporodiniella umbellata]